LLSSAILYVAIVAIWAGVLIPRWLRRDSAASERDREDVTTAEAEPEAEVVAQPAPPPRPREDTPGFERRPARHQEPTAPQPPVRPEARPRPQPETRAEVRAEGPGGPRDQEQKKVLAGRRRLLGMLLVLAIGSGALAFTGMAAWWVIVPPTVMLLGYMGLLREAAKADAERRELARTRATAAAAVAAARPDAAPAPATPAPPPPDAEVIDISASLTPAGQEFFDQYAEAKRRAVGDLARRLTG
jgi:Flp pilus assembly protein TadB